MFIDSPLAPDVPGPPPGILPRPPMARPVDEADRPRSNPHPDYHGNYPSTPPDRPTGAPVCSGPDLGRDLRRPRLRDPIDPRARPRRRLREDPRLRPAPSVASPGPPSRARRAGAARVGRGRPTDPPRAARHGRAPRRPWNRRLRSAAWIRPPRRPRRADPARESLVRHLDRGAVRAPPRPARGPRAVPRPHGQRPPAGLHRLEGPLVEGERALELRPPALDPPPPRLPQPLAHRREGHGAGGRLGDGPPRRADPPLGARGVRGDRPRPRLLPPSDPGLALGPRSPPPRAGRRSPPPPRRPRLDGIRRQHDGGDRDRQRPRGDRHGEPRDVGNGLRARHEAPRRPPRGGRRLLRGDGS